MAAIAEKHRLTLDVSEVRRSNVRSQLRSSLEDLGWSYRTYDRFWSDFPKRPQRLPKFLMVVADLAHIAKHYNRVESRHAWIASVRKSQLYFVAFVRTKEDERYAALVDDLVRFSDFRISVCRGQNESDIRLSVYQAVSAFDPKAVASVRYAAPRSALLVEFNDGTSGFVSWSDLGIEDLVSDLVPESATAGSLGRTVELCQKNGELFEIDSGSIRSLLDNQYRAALQEVAEHALVSVGQRIRSARTQAGLTQSALSERSGIDQAIISKLERGQHQPRYNTLERLANALDVSVVQLLSAREPQGAAVG